MNKLYPLQLWLTSIVLAPILFFIIGFSNSPNMSGDSGAFAVLLLFVFFGLFYSLPVFIVTFIAFKMIMKKEHNPLLVKVILNAIAVAGVFLTFMIIQGMNSLNWNSNRSGLVFSLIYSASIILSSMFYKMRKEEDQKPITSAL